MDASSTGAQASPAVNPEIIIIINIFVDHSIRQFVIVKNNFENQWT